MGSAFARPSSPGSSPRSYQEYVPRHLHDVYHAAFLLRQKLPADVVPAILDYAEYWVKSSANCTYHMTVTEDDLRVGSRTADSPEFQGPLYHTSPLIAGDYEELSPLHPLRKVVFTITSKDQGWSDYRQDHGTYNNSWTWFEATVLDWGSVAPEIPARRICINIHAGRDWKTHKVTWTWDSEDKSESEWITRLCRGQKIGINVWAQFAGWSNSIRAATIDIYTAGIR